MLVQRHWSFGLPEDQAQSIEKRLYLNDAILAASQRAAELAPDDSFVRTRLASGYWAKCQIDLLEMEAERAVALNPYDPQTLGTMGIQLAFSGRWDLGTKFAEKAIRLAGSNAWFPWWYAPAKRHWVRGEYPEALEALRHAYAEKVYVSHLTLAYILPSLDRLDEAKADVATLQKMNPNYTIHEADAFYRTLCTESSYREKMAGALWKAGCRIEDTVPERYCQRRFRFSC
jgi:tetratricopeptide (TPR) repeat protein